MARNVRFRPIADISVSSHSAVMNLVTLLLPYRRTNEEEARNAIRDCGLSPDDLAWRMTENGGFAFGRKSADADPLPEAQVRCLTEWARKRRVRLGFIGWETTES